MNIFRLKNIFEERRNTIKRRSHLACWQNRKELSDDDKDVIYKYSKLDEKLKAELDAYIKENLERANELEGEDEDE